jgi:cobalamin biosynthesis protein CobD/CbiB
MCVTAILTETERKRQDSSVHRAEERRCKARMMRVCGPTCTQSSVLTHASAAQGAKRWISRRNQATLTSNGMPLGECRIRNVKMQIIYALVWAVIFGFLASYLTSSSSTILNFLGYGAWLMCGLFSAFIFNNFITFISMGR